MAGSRVKAKPARPVAEDVVGDNGAAAPDPWAPLLAGPWGEVYALAKAQGLPPVTDLAALAGDFWPEGESAEGFVAAIYASRDEDAEAEG